MTEELRTKDIGIMRLPEEWKTVTLSELSVLMTNGFVGTSTPHYTQRGVPYLMANNVRENCLDDTSLTFITQQFHEANSRSCLKVGDILTVQTGFIGVSCLVPKSYEGANAHALIITRLDPRKSDSRFICQFINSSLGKRNVHRIQTAGGRPHLNTGDFASFTVPLPALNEQKRIAEILCKYDLGVELIKKLITAETKRRRGLMQHLLTGKKRFQEFANQKWERMRISSFADYKVRMKRKPEKPFTALGIRSHGRGTFLKPGFDPARIEMTELFEVRENDLIVNITFAWEGAIAIAGASDDGALVSHRFPTFEFKTDFAIPEFVRHVIVQKWFVGRLGLISPGGAGRNRVLSKKDFGKLEVLMPSVEEQRRIAAVLDACDKEIELLKKQVGALQRQKRGLMQKLLTGQIRVKVADEMQEELVSV